MALASARPKRNATCSRSRFGKLGPRQRHVALAEINRSDLSIQRRDNEAGKWSKMEIEGGKDAKRRLGLQDFFSRIHRILCKMRRCSGLAQGNVPSKSHSSTRNSPINTSQAS
jgi:hypothetical protein